MLFFRCIVPPKDLAGKVEDYGADDMSEYCVPAELKQFTLKSEIGRLSQTYLKTARVLIKDSRDS